MFSADREFTELQQRRSHHDADQQQGRNADFRTQCVHEGALRLAVDIKRARSGEEKSERVAWLGL